MTNATKRLDVYGGANGTALLEWSEFPAVVPDSYNVYLNGVFNQNVATLKATVTGLQFATGQPTLLPALTYQFYVAAVKAGLEISRTMNAVMTATPTNVMLVTPMRRVQPFGNAPIN